MLMAMVFYRRIGSPFAGLFQSARRVSCIEAAMPQSTDLHTTLRQALIHAARLGVDDPVELARGLTRIDDALRIDITGWRDGVRVQAEHRITRGTAEVGILQVFDSADLQTANESWPRLIWASRQQSIDPAPSVEALAQALWRIAPERRPEEIVIYQAGLCVIRPKSDDAWRLGLTRLHALASPRRCHVCGSGTRTPHYAYERLCVACGDFNLYQRLRSRPLHGRLALVTGGRIKIGHAVALRLLRAGADVIVTSRFPGDASARFAAEHDAQDWLSRLQVLGADFRRLSDLHRVIAHVHAQQTALDILINNAAQTVRMPDEHAALLRAAESAKLEAAHAALAGKVTPTHEALEPMSAQDLFAPTLGSNSWNRQLADTPATEIFEAHVVNAVAPAILCAELKPVLERAPREWRHIVNVSAPEGLFDAQKSGWHTHTNMAKAALNMLTRSIAAEYARARILVNSVDPGWVSDQMPRRTAREHADAEQRLPLSLEDAAARICAPILDAESGDRYFGQMRRHYSSVNW
jgi:NAD(P)-dependent dehydrogenase (short-subunit alcohol dehydrogenase family)